MKSIKKIKQPIANCFSDIVTLVSRRIGFEFKVNTQQHVPFGVTGRDRCGSQTNIKFWKRHPLLKTSIKAFALCRIEQCRPFFKEAEAG